MLLNTLFGLTNLITSAAAVFTNMYILINLIPDEVLWSPKEAFSDGCSSEKRSWHKIIQEYVDSIITDDDYLRNKHKYTFNTPISKESYWYRKIFEYYYPNKSNVIPHFWLPNWTNVKDPSARELCLNI